MTQIQMTPLHSNTYLPATSQMEQELIDHTILKARTWPYIVVGFMALFALVIGGAFWAITAKIGGAVIANGEFTIESKRQILQHLDGGIVQSLLVKEGDRVEKGQVVLQLDNTVEKSNYAILQNEHNELQAQRSRLLAELADKQDLLFPLEEEKIDLTARHQAILDGQRGLFKTRLQARLTEKDIQTKRTVTLQEQIDGLQKQIASNERQVIIIKDELVDIEDLANRQLLPKSRLLALKREAEQLQGQTEALNVSVSRARNAIDEVALETVRSQRGFKEQVTTELRTIEPRITQLAEQLTTAGQRLARSEIRAPSDGFVVGLQNHTQGGVIRPGEAILDIIPEGEELILEARIPTIDIDKVQAGHTARVQLIAFDQTRTPEAMGEVLSISADRLEDERTGESYYLARLSLATAEQPSVVQELNLLPGMPATVFIETGERTPFSYFLQPLTNRLNRAFAET